MSPVNKDGTGGTAPERLVYCHCAYAKVVPKKVKAAVLKSLGASDREFEAVPDLCEMSARKDPFLAELASGDGLRIVACYPRAVRWLFHAAGSDLKDGVEVLNMREDSSDAIATKLGIAPELATVESDPATVESGEPEEKPS